MKSKRVVMAPFTYRVEGSLKPEGKGRGKFGIYQLVDSVPVEIDVLDGEDAPPVVLRLHGADFRRRDGEILKEVRGAAACYASSPPAAARESEIDTMLSSFVEEFGTPAGQSWGHFLVGLQGMMEMWSVPRVNRSARFSKISSTNEEEARSAAVEQWRRGVSIIDGSLWCSVQEPVLKVMLTTDGVASIFVSEVPHIGGADAATFRMDRLEDAKAYAARLAGANINVGGHELVDATGWSFDDTGYDARLVFTRAVGILEKRNDFYWTSPEFMSAAFAIRDIDREKASNAELRDAVLVLRDAAAGIVEPMGMDAKYWATKMVEEMEWRWQQAGRDLDASSSDMAALARIGF